MMWVEFVLIVSMLLDAMAAVFTTMDSITLVVMPSSYAFTVLDMALACFITGEMVLFIESL